MGTLAQRRAVVLLLWVMFVFAGCARNGVLVMERVYDDGALVSELRVEQETVTVWGAEQSAGAGRFRYVGDDAGFEMEAGGEASGMESRDPVTPVVGDVVLEGLRLRGAGVPDGL